MKIIKNFLNYDNQKTHVFYLLPDKNIGHANCFALFSHGYTADKSSIFNWATRLVEVGVPCALFDLPGHYLGNFSEVLDFDYFKAHAHQLFEESFKGLKAIYSEEMDDSSFLAEDYFNDEFELVLGGHSLGALLAFKALELPLFQSMKKRAIGVGIGMAPKKVVHIFDTPFYKNTLLVREQLVSAELCSQNVFPWIKKEKEEMSLSQQKIHLITGADDLVVGEDGMERFAEHLIINGNEVTQEKPTRLPHHDPQLAAGHIKKYFKDQNLIRM